METQKIRSVLGWCVVINFFLLFFMGAVFFSLHETVTHIWNELLDISVEQSKMLMVLSITLWKLWTIVFFLIPYIAIGIVEKEQKKP